MTRVRLGLHINGHGHEEMVRRYVDAVRPPFVKFLGDAANPTLMDYCRSRGAKVIFRCVLGDEGVGASGAIDHIIRRSGEVAGHWDYTEFANEEMQGRENGDEGEWDRLCRLMRKAMDACERRGWRAVIFNTSVGQPELRVTGRPRWERPESVATLKQAAAGGHLVGVHEYYRPRPWYGVEGAPGQSDRTAWAFPGQARGWWMLRVARTIEEWRRLGIPLPKIVITESGRDANTGTPGDGKGWRDEPRTPDGDFADFMAGYCKHLSAWPEVVGVVDFGFSTAQPEKWGSFDLSQDEVMFERMITEQVKLLDSAPPPLPPPPPGGDPVSDRLSTLLADEFGGAYEDLRARLPAKPNGPNGAFGRLDPARVDGIAVHHTAGPKAQIWHDVAVFHVNTRGWAGIGYHIGIRQGRVALLGDITTARAHVQDENHHLIGVVLTGNYQSDPLDAADAGALVRVVAVLDRFLGRQVRVGGHREFSPPGHTVCPGTALAAVLPTIRGAPPAPGPAVDLRRLWSEADSNQTVHLNAAAGLQKAITAAGLVPTSDEWSHSPRHVAQRGESPTGGGAAVFVYDRQTGAITRHNRS